MTAHLGRCFPARCREMGPAMVRELIRYGITRAARYGIEAQRDVCKYIDVMIVFGRDFDEDPAHPWAQSILGDPSLRHAMVRVENLYEAAKSRSKGQYA